MEGANKVKLSREELERIARSAFDCGVVAGRELSDGWANSAYSLALEDGRKAVLKVAPAQGTRLMRYERNMMTTEVEAMKRIREGGEAPVPEIYVYDRSESLVPAPYFLMEHLDGEPYNKVSDTMTPETREKVELELGAMNARINAIRGSRFGLYGFESPHDDTWRGAFRWLLHGVLEDGLECGARLPAPVEELEKEVESRLWALDEIVEPRLVHWDLWPGNVFVQDGRITGLIDFERAMWGDPLIEHYFSHFGNSPAFLRGHGLSAPEPGRTVRRSLYDLYLDLILMVECHFRQYTDRNHVEWTERNLAESWERFRRS